MQINRVKTGKYSEIKLGDGRKIFLSLLPDRITASLMFLFIPTKKIWEFIFPFYIRTATEAWESSKMVLEITLKSIVDVETLTELKGRLVNETSKELRKLIKDHGDEAQSISIDKVGLHAIKKILDPRDLQNIETIVREYGKIQEMVSQELDTKYPGIVFPESLLPYSKGDIKKALSDAIQYTDDMEMVENLKVCSAFLDGFINDEEANKKNEQILKIIREGKNKPKEP